MAAGQAQDGIAEGSRGRERPEGLGWARHRAGTLLRGQSQPSVQVCMCVHTCVRAPACQARAPQPHTREPEQAVPPTPGTRRGLAGRFDETA